MPEKPTFITNQKLPSDVQLEMFRQDNPEPSFITTSAGAPVHQKKAVLTAGPRGPMLMQDFVFMNEMAHFDRERIPERIAHAKGGGAHGFLEITHDITKYCKAHFLAELGKKTPCFIRLSTVAGDQGSADTVRDVRGFALKVYTEEGNWDMVGINTPTFFIRDGIFFPSFVHSQQRNPKTHFKDVNAMFDFYSLRPESIHQ
ncbi:unnamed protein product, partial [Mesorhabditis spiculigera]